MRLSSVSFLLLVSSSTTLAQKERTSPSSDVAHRLMKISNRKDRKSVSTTKSEGNNLQTCYYNLLSSSNYDSTLSQSDFLIFVSLQSSGIGVQTSWGTEVTSFYQLSPMFVGVYNKYACGDAHVGCPSVEGIRIDSVYDLEDGVLGRLCRSMDMAVENYRVQLGLDESHELLDDFEKHGSDSFGVSFTYQIGNTAGLYANSIITSSNPSNSLQTYLVAGISSVVKHVVQRTFDEVNVEYVDGSTKIESIEDIKCATRRKELVCQKVLISIEIIQTNQTESDVELILLRSINQAINEGELIFPMEKGVILGLGIEEKNIGVNWKVPILACASVVLFISSLIFTVMRKSHRDDQIGSNKDSNLFLGELMQSDAKSLKIRTDRSTTNHQAKDTEQGSSTCSSSDKSHPFSDVSRASSNSSTSSNAESAPGNTLNEYDEEFSSIVEGANNNPFSLQSIASSSIDDAISLSSTITPGKSMNLMVYEQSGESSCDSLDSYVKTGLALDDCDGWLSTVKENEYGTSILHVSSLNEVINKNAVQIESIAKLKCEDPVIQSTTSTKSHCSEQMPVFLKENALDEHATLSEENMVCSLNSADDNIASQLVIIDDTTANINGTPSIEPSTISSNITFMEASRVLLGNIGAAFHSRKTSQSADKRICDDWDSDSLGEIKRDLVSAIHAGDWTTISATALLLTKTDPKSTDLDDQLCMYSQEQSILISQTQKERSFYLEKLVNAGDWQGIMRAIAKYEDSDKESFSISVLDKQELSTDSLS